MTKKYEVVQVRTIKDLTILLLQEEVGEGLRKSNGEIAAEIREAFGSKTTPECVAWYASKLNHPEYREKWGVSQDYVRLTPRREQK